MQFQIQHIKLGGSCAMQESQIDELYNMVKEQWVNSLKLFVQI